MTILVTWEISPCVMAGRTYPDKHSNHVLCHLCLPSVSFLLYFLLFPSFSCGYSTIVGSWGQTRVVRLFQQAPLPTEPSQQPKNIFPLVINKTYNKYLWTTALHCSGAHPNPLLLFNSVFSSYFIGASTIWVLSNQSNTHINSVECIIPAQAEVYGGIKDQVGLLSWLKKVCDFDQEGGFG